MAKKKPTTEEKNAALGYTPSDKQVEVASRIVKRIQEMKIERDKPRQEFDGRTLEEYVNDNTNAYNGIVSPELKASKEDWQSLIFDNKTRGKVKAVVAMVAATRPYLNLIGETEEADKFAEDMFDAYDYSHRKENGSYKTYLQILSAAVKGTVIVEEKYTEIKKKVKEITSIDVETGQVEFIEKTVIKDGAGQITCDIVPILDFYMNESHADIEEDCFKVEYLTKHVFSKRYGKFPNAEHVSAGICYTNPDGSDYKKLKTDRKDIVEVVKYYNELEDEYILLANGIWINPQKEDEVCPLPFDHKRLPFVKTFFEMADEECQYGKALPDLIAGEQDTINAVLRMMIDQEILSIHKPILLGMGVELESYQLFPGKQVRTSGDITQIKEMDMSGASQSSFMLLDWLEKRADVNTSIDTNSQGVGGSRKTAKEAVIIDENAKRIASTFQIFIYKLIRGRAELRIPNIKQFYKKPVGQADIVDEKGMPIRIKGVKQTKDVFRQLPIDKPGKNRRWLHITEEMLSHDFEIRIEEDYEMSYTRSQRIELARVLLDEAKLNPLLNADEVVIEWLTSLGKNPQKFYIKPTPKNSPNVTENTPPVPVGAPGAPAAPIQ
jgi:hypothetical protein